MKTQMTNIARIHCMKSFWKTFVLILFAWVGGLTASFAQNQSNDNVYAVGCTPRLKVVFHMDGVNDTIYITAADKDAGDLTFNTVVYNPWHGTIASDISFFGWTTNANYTADDKSSAMAFPAVQDSVKTKLDSFTDGEEVHYYAMLFKHYTVTYKDVDDAVLASDPVFYKASENNPGVSYTVNKPYTPHDGEHNFDGWKVEGSGAHISELEDNDIIHNNENITISGDVTFSVNAPGGKWLVFKENGKGATYCAPQFVKSDSVTKLPRPEVDMKRLGYTFQGWYEDSLCTTSQASPSCTPYTFGNTLTNQTTLFAKWTPRTTAPYTVIIWKQNLNGDGYDFAESISLNGTVGSSINLTSNNINISCVNNGNSYNSTIGNSDNNNAYENNKRTTGNGYEVSFRNGRTGTYYAIKLNGTWYRISNNGNIFYDNATSISISIDITSININDYNYTGFTRQPYEQKTVTPEGNTVVNVYYNRNQYTLTFQDHPYTVTTSGSGTQYALIDGQYVQLTRSGNNNYWYNGQRYNGTRYTQGNGWQTIKTITARYQQPIGGNFPIGGNNGATYNHGERWDPQSNTPYSEVLVYIDVMPSANVTFHLDVATHSTKTIHYYVEAIEGETPERPYNGKGFSLYKSVDANYNWFTEAEDYIELVGFTKGGGAYPPEAYNSNGTKLNSVWNNVNVKNVYCYYTRDKYRILFMDGQYVDGDNNPIEGSINRGELHRTEEYSYDSDLSSFNKEGTNYYEPAAINGYVFEGWYIDDACTSPYTFDKMPSAHITVYAKWRQIQYRVFFHPNAEDDETLDWGSDNQAMNFRTSYGDKVSAPTGTRGEKYEFVGWFKDDSTFNDYFNAEVWALNDEVVTTPYDKTTDFTDPMDKFGEGATWNSDIQDEHGNPRDRFWITRKLDLYGKWRKIIIGNIGIQMIYDANGGSNAPTDDNLYVDNTSVVAGQAPTAPTAPANKVFSHWVVQKWNGSGFVDTEVTVLPGASFTSKLADAHDVEHEDQPDSEGHTHDYTIQLRAEYVDIESASTTTITWNDEGSDTPNPVEINHPVEIPIPSDRTGYIFVGWSKSNNTDCEPDFLKYDFNSGDSDEKFKYGDCSVSYVAADIFSSQNTLYAVWIPDDVCPDDYGFIAPDNGSGKGDITFTLPTENCVQSWTENNNDLSVTGNTVSGALPFGVTAVEFTAIRISGNKICPITIRVIKQTDHCANNGD